MLFFVGKLTIMCPIVLAYVLQVKVEMELEIQQYEKAKAVREEQLDRLTQICQEQAVCPLISLIYLTYLQSIIYSCMQPAEGSKALCKKNKLNLYSKRHKRCLQNVSSIASRSLVGIR